MAKIARVTRSLLVSKIRSPTFAISRQAAPCANFQTSVWGRPGLKDRLREKEQNQKALQIKQEVFFDEQSHDKLEQKNKKDKKMFEQAIAVYLKRERARRRGHVEFIYAAMKRMKEFGVERDIQTYKKLMDVFPKAKMVAQNSIQVEFMHYPRQQQCCIDMLQQMEDHGVVPDDEMGYQVYYTFGKDTHAMRKYQRMMYWMPKFKNINPWPIPKLLPKDPTELAKIALKRMAVDIENQLATFWSETLPEAFDKTWIVSAQSPAQRGLLAKHNSENPIYVEGGYHVWTRYKSLTYFCLRADPEPDRLAEAKQFVKEEREKDSSYFDADKWKVFFEDEDLPNQVIKAPTAHEQEDGTYLAMCITGTASKDSLQSWIKFLQATNPKLVDTPVVFKLVTPESGVQTVEEDGNANSSVQMPGQYV